MSSLRPSQTSFTSPDKVFKSYSEISTIGQTSRKYISRYSQQEIVSKKSVYYAETTQSDLKLKKVQSIIRKQRIRQIIGRMIFTKQLTYQKVFKKFKSLISQESSPIPFSGSNGQSKLGEGMIWKTKLNLQTSLVRSALRLQSLQKDLSKKKQLTALINSPQRQMKIGIQTNVMICPDEFASLKIKQKQAILMLIPFARMKIRQVIRKFERNVEHEKIKDSYCQRMYNSARARCRVFIQKLRLIVKLDKQLVITTKRKTVSDLLNKCLNRRDKVFYENFKNHKLMSGMKKSEVILKMRKNSQYKMLQTLNLWYKKADLKKHSKQEKTLTITHHQTISIQPVKVEPVEENPFQKKKEHLQCLSIQIQAEVQQVEQIDPNLIEKRENKLKKIIMRRHLQKWGFHARFRRNLERCAIKFACAPKISIQRSFWRLNIFAYRDL